MNDYLNSIKARDPAAKSILSIILTYPGVKAVFFHRVANFFHIAGFHLIARIISQTSRFRDRMFLLELQLHDLNATV